MDEYQGSSITDATISAIVNSVGASAIASVVSAGAAVVSAGAAVVSVAAAVVSAGAAVVVASSASSPQAVSPVEEIIETIRKCPSGALSYIIDDVHYQDYFEGVEQIVVEEDGPYNIEGKITLIDDQDSDKLLPMADHYVLCRCGGSKKKPICDGSHLDNGFKG